MNGPEIFARTLSNATGRGSAAKVWQYHSRSDAHSKIACWTVLFDLLTECDALRQQALAGRVGFGINHVMVGPINKTLDLVITVVPPSRVARKRKSFATLAAKYKLCLTSAEEALLAGLPTLEMDSRDDVSEVAVALEAKACMTEHIKSLPRLHAEILATGYLAKKAVPQCISVSYTLVNSAEFFCTPSGEGKINSHNQPDDARRVVEMITKAVPTRTDSKDYGYDVVGITTIDCRNDGTAIRVVDAGDAAPQRADHTHYERMIRSICSEYRSRFAR